VKNNAGESKIMIKKKVNVTARGNQQQQKKKNRKVRKKTVGE
jgi:hypothetical protein